VFAAIDAGVHPLATHIETGPLVHVVNMVDRLHSRDRRCAALDPRSRQWRAGGEDRDGDHAATGNAGARDAQYPGPEPEALPQQGEIDFARIRAATPLLARHGMLKDATSAAERFVDLRDANSSGIQDGCLDDGLPREAMIGEST